MLIGVGDIFESVFGFIPKTRIYVMDNKIDCPHVNLADLYADFSRGHVLPEFPLINYKTIELQKYVVMNSIHVWLGVCPKCNKGYWHRG